MKFLDPRKSLLLFERFEAMNFCILICRDVILHTLRSEKLGRLVSNTVRSIDGSLEGRGGQQLVIGLLKMSLGEH